MPVWMLEKDRAKDAWDCVRAIAAETSARQKRYRSQVRGASAMVQRNGLGQFFAFLAAKGFDTKDKTVQLASKDEDYGKGKLYQHLGRWLCDVLKLKVSPPKAEEVLPSEKRKFDPLDDLLLKPDCDLAMTMRATREALAWLQWAKRFAESQLEEPEPNEEG